MKPLLVSCLLAATLITPNANANVARPTSTPSNSVELNKRDRFKAGFNKFKENSIKKSKELAASTSVFVSEKSSELNDGLHKGVNKTIKMKAAMQTAWNEE